MNNTYFQPRLTNRARYFGLLALLSGAATASAQTLPYSATATVSRAGTYVDLGTNGTAIATPNTDDANSNPLPIGFIFNYNGTPYTMAVLNTNGLLKLGAVAPTTADFMDYAEENTGGPVANAADTDVLMPFNTDLQTGPGGAEYRMHTTGVAPNRTLIIQWKNVQDKPMRTSSTDATLQATQYASISFQVKLHETSSDIEFVYGPSTAGSPAGDNYKYVNVGLKGSGSATNQLVLAQKASVSGWSTTVFLNTPYVTNTHNVRGSLRPDLGRTYTFGVAVPNDAAVADIQGFGAVLAPGGGPVTIRAVVRNSGTTNLSNIPVTMTVTGANNLATRTQTIPALSVGNSTTVTFANVALPAVGSNTVTMTIPADGNATNNTLTQPLATSATDYSYIVPTAGLFNGYGTQPGNESGFAAKFTFNTIRDIVSVRAFITDYAPTATAGSTIGQTVYGVVVDALSGAILARSPNYVVTAADANAIHTFVLSSPVTVPPGDVLAGMVVIAPAGVPQFYAMGVQHEEPSRPNTFYGVSPAGGAPVAAAATANYRYMVEISSSVPATCPAPGSIVLSNITQTGVTVAFSGPNNGTGYQIVYVPTGTTPTATSPTTPTFASSPYTLPNGTLAAGTGYDIYVRALCGATDRSGLAGPAFFSTPCAPPIINSFPYSQNFDVIAAGQPLPCGVKVSDENTDGVTWEPASTVISGVASIPVTRNNSPFAMVYQTNPDGTTDGNDWFYLPAMRFGGGQRYRVSFYYRSSSNSTAAAEGLEVKYGTASTAAAQTNLLWSRPSFANASFLLADNTTAATQAVADIVTPAGPASLNYIGFHAISQADRQFMAVEDVTVTAVLATSSALTRAVNVYPNPSATGLFVLDVVGAPATSALQVEVTNMLGQRVYTSTAPNNLRTELNLSALPSGIYSMKVKSGSEYMQQQLSIVK